MFIWEGTRKDGETVHNSVINLRELQKLLVPAISGRGRERSYPVCQDGSVAALQQHAQLSPQVPHSLFLLLPWLVNWRVSAAPSLPTSLTEASCHPPKDSNAMDRKVTPCCWQASAAPLIFTPPRLVGKRSASSPRRRTRTRFGSLSNASLRGSRS